MSSEKASQALAALHNGTLQPGEFPAAGGIGANTNGASSREYLRPDEAAAMLDVHPKTLERWAARDATLPVLKIAGTTRYPRERLLRWLQRHEQGRQPSTKRMLLPSATRTYTTNRPYVSPDVSGEGG